MGAGWGQGPVVGLKIPPNPKVKKNCNESFDPNFFFRLLKDPKRLGLGQKVPGKHPSGSNEPRFMGPKHRGSLKYQNGPKMAIFEKKNLFSRFGHKTGKTARFYISEGTGGIAET